MTDPTPVGPIDVVGQRRRYSYQTFPARGGGGTGTGGGEEQNEIGDEGVEGPEAMSDPCLDPATALPWNADAAAAASVAAFLQRAAALGDTRNGAPTLGNREFGRGLANGSGSSVSGNAVSNGNPSDPGSSVATMTINMDGITPYTYLGDVHSHPFGTALPSEQDWISFMATNAQARAVGRTQETFYLYIITVDQNGNPSTIHVYQDGPRAANSTNPPWPTEKGPEVNPDAQPCG